MVVGTPVGENEGAPVYTGMLLRDVLARTALLASSSCAVTVYSSTLSRAVVNGIVMLTS